jgi:hypothetical protein
MKSSEKNKSGYKQAFSMHTLIISTLKGVPARGTGRVIKTKAPV